MQIHSSVRRMAIYISDVYTMIRAVLEPIWVQLNASTTNMFEKKMYITALGLKNMCDSKCINCVGDRQAKWRRSSRGRGT